MRLRLPVMVRQSCACAVEDDGRSAACAGKGLPNCAGTQRQPKQHTGRRHGFRKLQCTKEDKSKARSTSIGRKKEKPRPARPRSGRLSALKWPMTGNVIDSGQRTMQPVRHFSKCLPIGTTSRSNEQKAQRRPSLHLFDLLQPWNICFACATHCFQHTHSILSKVIARSSAPQDSTQIPRGCAFCKRH